MQDTRHGQPDVTLADVERAATVIKGAVITTPCDPSRTLSAKHGCEIWLKFENLQFTSSYKERGALNRLTALTPGPKSVPVVRPAEFGRPDGSRLDRRQQRGPHTVVLQFPDRGNGGTTG